MGHLRANICKTEDGETLGSLGMVEENRGGTREAPASGQTNLFAAGAAVPFRPVRRVRRQCQRAAGAVAARGRGVVRFGSPDPDPSALLPYNSISPPSNTTRPTNSREY